jgi:hypothetical protein
MAKKRLDPMSALLADKISGESFLRRQRQQEELEHERQLAAIRAGSKPEAPAIKFTDTPPLHPFTRDGIRQAMFRVDELHWPFITQMRAKKHYPLDQPVPPSVPEVLMGHIRAYASVLLKTEADQYEQFRDDARYPTWLAQLVDRVVSHVLTALERLDASDPDSLLLAYHGLTLAGIESSLRTFLREITQPYTGGIARPGPAVTASSDALALAIELASNDQISSVQAERIALRDAYRATFPDVKIADIIWAAKQTRREWTRWIGGEAKAGLKADRAFRHVLMSGKTPEMLMGKPRPTKYNV